MTDPRMWIKCMECGAMTSPDLNDCVCDECDGHDWSEPFPEGQEPKND